MPDVGEIDQKAALAAEKQPLGEAGLQRGQGLTVDDALLRAVDQAAPPGTLRPYQVAQGEADPEAVGENLQPLQRVPPQLGAAAQSREKRALPDGLLEKAVRVERVAVNGGLGAGG